MSDPTALCPRVLSAKGTRHAGCDSPQGALGALQPKGLTETLRYQQFYDNHQNSQVTTRRKRLCMLLLLFRLAQRDSALLDPSARCESKVAMSIGRHPTAKLCRPFLSRPSVSLHQLCSVLRQDHLFCITIPILARHWDIWKTALSTLGDTDTELDTISIPTASLLTGHALPHSLIQFVPLTSSERG